MITALDRPDTLARLFLGFSVPEGIRGKLREIAQRSFGDYFDTFLPEENWHLTLFFFGEVRNHAQYLGRLQQRLPQAFVPTFSITHLGRGAQRDQLWAFVTPTPALLTLRDNLDERLRKIHFPRPVPARKFVPHIHLADFYPTVRGMGLADVPVGLAYASSEAHLYQSSLHSKTQGRLYAKLAAIPLTSH